jgi:hypothetical protein
MDKIVTLTKKRHTAHGNYEFPIAKATPPGHNASNTGSAVKMLSIWQVIQPETVRNQKKEVIFLGKIPKHAKLPESRRF